MVTVYLHTILVQQTPEGPQRRLQVSLAEGSTLADLLARLQIALEPEHLLLVVNGRVVELDHKLSDGDQVNLMPAMSGGR